MTWIKGLVSDECQNSPEFKAAYQEESAICALVRARYAADLSQRELAEVLNVSQPSGLDFSEQKNRFGGSPSISPDSAS